MKLLSPIVILLFLYRVSGLQDTFADCDNDSWHAFREKKCFKVVIDEFVSHDDAQKFCIDQFGDSTLIRINSLEEQEFVTKLVFETYQVVDNVWLGAIRETDSATDFVWDDQSELGFTWWADGSPSGDFAKNCTQLTSRLSKSRLPIERQEESLLVEDGQWMDAACSKRNLVVCQKSQNWTFDGLKDAVVKLQAQVASLEEFVGMVPPGSRPKNCNEVQRVGTNTIYEIYPFGADGRAVSVQCDFETDGGNWTIIHQRSSGPLAQFFLNWNDYEEGFGEVEGNYWIGLQAMNSLTFQADQELRVELGDWEGNRAYARYNTFKVGNSSDLYRLTVGGYSGDAGDSMVVYHNGNSFSTRDKDNDDVESTNLALYYHGAWWYGVYTRSCLNGYYYPSSTAQDIEGLFWYNWKGTNYSLKSAQMKIRDRTRGPTIVLKPINFY